MCGYLDGQCSISVPAMMADAMWMSGPLPSSFVLFKIPLSSPMLDLELNKEAGLQHNDFSSLL